MAIKRFSTQIIRPEILEEEMKYRFTKSPSIRPEERLTVNVNQQ